MYAAITRYSPLGEAVLVEEDVVLEVPAVLKPRALWTGKQVCGGGCCTGFCGGPQIPNGGMDFRYVTYVVSHAHTPV